MLRTARHLQNCLNTTRSTSGSCVVPPHLIPSTIARSIHKIMVPNHRLDLASSAGICHSASIDDALAVALILEDKLSLAYVTSNESGIYMHGVERPTVPHHFLFAHDAEATSLSVYAGLKAPDCTRPPFPITLDDPFINVTFALVQPGRQIARYNATIASDLAGSTIGTLPSSSPGTSPGSQDTRKPSVHTTSVYPTIITGFVVAAVIALAVAGFLIWRFRRKRLLLQTEATRPNNPLPPFAPSTTEMRSRPRNSLKRDILFEQVAEKVTSPLPVTGSARFVASPVAPSRPEESSASQHGVFPGVRRVDASAEPLTATPAALGQVSGWALLTLLPRRVRSALSVNEPPPAYHSAAVAQSF